MVTAAIWCAAFGFYSLLVLVGGCLVRLVNVSDREIFFIALTSIFPVLAAILATAAVNR